MDYKIPETYHYNGLKDIPDDRVFTWRFFLDLTPNKRVLILSNEWDSLSLIISENVKEVICIGDYFKKNMIALVKKQEKQNKNIEWVASDCHAVPFPANCFDTIIVGRYIENLNSLHDFTQFLKKISFYLKSGGQIALFFRNPLRINSISLTKRLKKFLSLYGYARLFEKAHLKKPQIILEGTGVYGEKFLFPKNDVNALRYYYHNFIGINSKAKKLVYDLLVNSHLYKLIVDKYLFIAKKT